MLTLNEFLTRQFVKLDEKTGEPLYEWGDPEHLFCVDTMIAIYEMLAN